MSDECQGWTLPCRLDDAQQPTPEFILRHGARQDMLSCLQAQTIECRCMLGSADWILVQTILLVQSSHQTMFQEISTQTLPVCLQPAVHWSIAEDPALDVEVSSCFLLLPFKGGLNIAS